MAADLLEVHPATGQATSSPLPPHGTYARSVGRPSQGIPGCSCEPCRAERSRYRARRDLLAATGRSLTVDAAPAIAHVRQLLANGGGWNQICAASGCSASTISDLNHARRDTIRRSTAHKILAVRLADVVPEPASVPALGTVRRLQALMAIGHSPTAIAAATGCHETSVTDIVYGRGTGMVRPGTARLVAGMFEHLSARPGPHALSRRRAAARGWPPPLAWDDIDDPDEQPVVARPAADARRLAVVEDTAELAAQGETRERIAARLGISWGAIARSHTRAGVPVPEVFQVPDAPP